MIESGFGPQTPDFSHGVRADVLVVGAQDNACV